MMPSQPNSMSNSLGPQKSGKLEKALIKIALEDEGKASNTLKQKLPLTVCFNPKEYTLGKTAPWVHHPVQGFDNPALQWTTGGPMSLSVELHFDAYEDEDQNVRRWTDVLIQLQLVDQDLHRPPKIMFCWGEQLQLKCVLARLTVRFTMFLANGTPVRAVANCEFLQANSPEEQRRGVPLHSPDHTKRRVVKQGDTLAGIASQEYGNPAEWRLIARANGIEDPMHLTIGQQLLVPPLY